MPNRPTGDKHKHSHRDPNRTRNSQSFSQPPERPNHPDDGEQRQPLTDVESFYITTATLRQPRRSDAYPSNNNEQHRRPLRSSQGDPNGGHGKGCNPKPADRAGSSTRCDQPGNANRKAHHDRNKHGKPRCPNSVSQGVSTGPDR